MDTVTELKDLLERLDGLTDSLPNLSVKQHDTIADAGYVVASRLEQLMKG